MQAEILIVGLAPGLKGANFTGRPFTGDYAGELLYPTLLDFGFATGQFEARADDSLELINCRITNAVRCVPPQNKPTGAEIKQCRSFLEREIASMPNLKILVALGRIAHDAVLKALEFKLASCKFGHGHIHDLKSYTLIDSYHCSRYNTQTRRLTPEMFADIFAEVQNHLE